MLSDHLHKIVECSHLPELEKGHEVSFVWKHILGRGY